MVQFDDSTTNDLPVTHVFITAHDTNGKPVFLSQPDHSEEVKLKRVGPAGFDVFYSTKSVPVDFTDNKDIKEHKEQSKPLPIKIPNGSIIRMVDLAPGEQSPMHRTNSLDYGVVLEGEVVLILDDYDHGPRRIMKRGDVSVQRATNHAWRNNSTTAWSRMLYVLLDASSRNGKEEDWGGIELPQ
jgi:quercetin dioxygenase-like cupin family protein